MSWIHLTDLTRAILYCLAQDQISGPVNGFAPNPVTNQTFVSTLVRTIHRPALLPAPAFLLRLVFGEMANELFLSSLRGRPDRLLGSGFNFEYPDLAPALKDLLR